MSMRPGELHEIKKILKEEIDDAEHRGVLDIYPLMSVELAKKLYKLLDSICVIESRAEVSFDVFDLFHENDVRYHVEGNLENGLIDELMKRNLVEVFTANDQSIQCVKCCAKLTVIKPEDDK